MKLYSPVNYNYNNPGLKFEPVLKVFEGWTRATKTQLDPHLPSASLVPPPLLLNPEKDDSLHFPPSQETPSFCWPNKVKQNINFLTQVNGFMSKKWMWKMGACLNKPVNSPVVGVLLSVFWFPPELWQFQRLPSVCWSTPPVTSTNVSHTIHVTLVSNITQARMINQ